MAIKYIQPDSLAYVGQDGLKEGYIRFLDTPGVKNMARLIINAFSEDTIAAPGNRQPNYIVVSVTDVNGNPVPGLGVNNFKVRSDDSRTFWGICEHCKCNSRDASPAFIMSM